ncbi:zinc finger, C3HC4 type (RING finger) domain containing protein [Acanthamoeba castellanii str. Neff]|uniref:Zinc finger, C3HC4 type (RING finger) domain containing protein n=1 Tax=Acanthamoeba castellanii (strain ATCC 30010 / Neff) TaxID=1257118 RepID=L8HBK5_ACACF|nr:zinc finger, C3HC4 type (RING finger) domain containing protein [Acanthamoeba castellanii str. Neff]ELR22934.1 zinc finger, C3HC4 type (RING finger) domain containing protein [Acanthamoeba castellanii str. Neff]
MAEQPPPWTVTYHEEGERVLGCKHYRRGSRIRAPCCDGALFTCHSFAVRQMQCMHCGLEQPAQKCCSAEGCKKQLGLYYCNICHLWSDDPKKSIFHCVDCGICRIGKGLGVDFFHCSKCKACLAISLQNNHQCIEDVLNTNCPVCWEHLFTSRDPLSVLTCGHSMHKACFETYTRNGFYRCPTCQRMLFDPREALIREVKVKALRWGKRLLQDLIALICLAYLVDRFVYDYI